MLKKNWIPAFLLTGALLAGCGSEEKNNASSSASDGESASTGMQDSHTASDQAPNGQASQKMTAPIKEAENIPEAEKKAILAVLDKQISAFNSKKIDEYMSTISKTPASFKYEEEKEYIEKVFQTFDAAMTPINTTIIKYDEKTKTANVFMNIKSTSKDINSGKEVSQTTRQIMVFQKETGGWKQVSLFAME